MVIIKKEHDASDPDPSKYRFVEGDYVENYVTESGQVIRYMPPVISISDTCTIYVPLDDEDINDQIASAGIIDSD